MKISSIRETTSLALIIGGLINVCYILSSYSHYLEVYSLCGIDDVKIIQPNLLSLLSINQVILFAGTYGILSPYIKSLLSKLTRDELKRLFHYFVLSCGSLYYYDKKLSIRFYSKDLTLHRIFSDLAYITYNKYPTTIKIRNSYVTQFYNKNIIIKKLDDVMNERKEMKKEFIRMLMSSDGWITCFLSSNRIYPKLGLGSTMPHKELERLSSLLSEFKINFNIYIDPRYGDRGFLASSSFSNLESFAEIGGFIEGVQIKKGVFEGIEKKTLLHAIIRLKDFKFRNKEEALQNLRWAGMDDNLKAYLYRIMLG
ncbi:MAG: hypothetical protein N3D72_00475 [Candidatus Methanomethyliaceae archaeon]|nr:hypothetical protein [Candidatus Methanomethyliaceae archaeon]